MYESCWSETNRLPEISPAKISLFKINRVLLFQICNHDKPRASPQHGGKGSWEDYSKQRPHVFSQLSPCQERREVFLLSVGLCYLKRVWELSLLVFLLYWFEAFVYYFFTFSHFVQYFSLKVSRVRFPNCSRFLCLDVRKELSWVQSLTSVESAQIGNLLRSHLSKKEG